MSTTQIVLFVFGFLSAVTGVFFIYKKIGDGENDIDIKPFGKIKTKSSGIIFFIVGASCIITGSQLKPDTDSNSNVVDKKSVVNHFNYSRIIRDEKGNAAADAFAFIIMDNETLYSHPTLTGDDGRFNISVDTSEGALLPFYFGKQGYDTIHRNENIISLGGSESYTLRKKIIPIADSTFFITGVGTDQQLIHLIEQQTGYHYLSTLAKNRIVINYDQTQLESDPEDVKNFRYNGGGKVSVSVNGNHCFTINSEIAATLSIYQSRNKVMAQINADVKNIVHTHQKLIAQEINKCLK